MSEFTALEVEIVRLVASCDEYTVFEALDRADHQPVRLTVFSAEVSQSPEFRRALKSNRAILMMLQHQSVLKFLGSGENTGQLYYWTSPSTSQSLAAQIRSGRRFSAEDVIEIGWQVCSALQQAHNLGLAHGGLCAESILISDSLQVMLSEFGVARWLKVAHEARDAAPSNSALITVSTLASRVEVEKDLTDLANVLLSLLSSEHTATEAMPKRTDSTSPENAGAQSSTDLMLERMLTRLANPSSPNQLTSAREFQGRLGEILIGPGDDAMPLVDRREPAGTSKRSIIVELFEPPESIDQIPNTGRQSAGTARRWQILPLIVIVAIVVVVTLLAGLFR